MIILDDYSVMTTRLTILGDMTDLNEYINKNRSNKFQGHIIKKEETERVAWEARAQKIHKFDKLVLAYYYFYPKNMRRDEDNLLIYIKFINDGLKMAGVIKNDSPKDIRIAGIQFLYDARGARTIVDLIEAP